MIVELTIIQYSYVRSFLARRSRSVSLEHCPEVGDCVAYAQTRKTEDFKNTCLTFRADSGWINWEGCVKPIFQRPTIMLL